MLRLNEQSCVVLNRCSEFSFYLDLNAAWRDRALGAVSFTCLPPGKQSGSAADTDEIHVSVLGINQPLPFDWRSMSESTFDSESGSTRLEVEVWSTFKSEEDFPKLRTNDARLKFHQRNGIYYTLELEANFIDPKLNWDMDFQNLSDLKSARKVTTELHLLGEAAFDGVRVNVPLNVQDPMKYAQSAARKYVGLDSFGKLSTVLPRFSHDPNVVTSRGGGALAILNLPAEWQQAYHG